MSLGFLAPAELPILLSLAACLGNQLRTENELERAGIHLKSERSDGSPGNGDLARERSRYWTPQTVNFRRVLLLSAV